jgi:predicted DNA-binding antitoxin AbrB/MazE fold protein
VTVTVEATYENGCLKLLNPLPLKEHTRVQVTVHTAKNWVEETKG